MVSWWPSSPSLTKRLKRSCPGAGDPLAVGPRAEVHVHRAEVFALARRDFQRAEFAFFVPHSPAVLAAGASVAAAFFLLFLDGCVGAAAAGSVSGQAVWGRWLCGGWPVQAARPCGSDRRLLLYVRTAFPGRMSLWISCSSPSCSRRLTCKKEHAADAQFAATSLTVRSRPINGEK